MLVSDTELEKSTDPSVNESIPREKDSTDGAGVEIGEARNNEQEEDGLEYPKAFAMAMILVALSLSIFLVALDMTIVVCLSFPSTRIWW